MTVKNCQGRENKKRLRKTKTMLTSERKERLRGKPNAKWDPRFDPGAEEDSLRNQGSLNIIYSFVNSTQSTLAFWFQEFYYVMKGVNSREAGRRAQGKV